MSELYISEEILEQDDEARLARQLQKWRSPDIDTALDLLDRQAGKPHTTLCLLNFLHSCFPAEMIQAVQAQRREKDLGDLSLEDEDWADSFIWEENDDHIRILHYTGSDEEILIPEALDAPVTEVSRLFFADDSPVRSLLVPEGIRIGTVKPHEARRLYEKTLQSPEIIHTPRETEIKNTYSGEEEPLFCNPDHFTVGQIVQFGRYAYEASGSVRPMEWKVLDTDGRTALLLSLSIVERLPYHSRRTAVFWGNCDLRRWLNETFAEAAFTEAERARLIENVHTGARNPLFHSRKNPDSSEKIFLLSPEEWVQNIGEQAGPVTETPWSQGSGRPCPVWLRMPGLNTQYAVTCGRDGKVSWQGNLVQDKNVGIIPAVRIRLGPLPEGGAYE